jgi:hypothetical protein
MRPVLLLPLQEQHRHTAAATAADPGSEAWTTILSHASVLQDPRVVCKLLQVCCTLLQQQCTHNLQAG